MDGWFMLEDSWNQNPSSEYRDTPYVLIQLTIHFRFDDAVPSLALFVSICFRQTPNEILKNVLGLSYISGYYFVLFLTGIQT